MEQGKEQQDAAKGGFEGKEWGWDEQSHQGILCRFLGSLGKVRAAWLGSHSGLGGGPAVLVG